MKINWIDKGKKLLLDSLIYNSIFTIFKNSNFYNEF